jgi:hypothetical protein
MNEQLYAALFAWAITLSGYPEPKHMPHIVQVPSEFLAINTCRGNPHCKALGGFAGGDEIYYDRKLNPENDLFVKSIIVHELVHYLQQEAHGSPGHSCEELTRREKEAYAIQWKYLTRHGYNSELREVYTIGCPNTGHMAAKE